MAWVEDKPNGTCLVRWREPATGKTASRSAPDRAAAGILKLEVELEIRRGRYVPQEQRRLPFGEYARQVLDADGTLAETTRENYDRCLRLQLAPLATTPIEDITPGRVRSLFASMRGASPNVLHMMRKTLSKVCSVAVEDGILPRNPAKAVRTPPTSRRLVEPLTPEQIAEASYGVPGRWRAAVLLAAWGGLRIGEVGALDRDDIDWDRGAVRISKSMSHRGLKAAKTKSSNRVVTLPAFVMKALREHVLEFAGEQVLFPTAKGNRINHWTIAPIMRPTGYQFHDLRYTAVAILIREGAHPAEIRERMGHSSITTTMNEYGHLFEGAHDELARRLERFDPGEMGKVVELS